VPAPRRWGALGWRSLSPGPVGRQRLLELVVDALVCSRRWNEELSTAANRAERGSVACRWQDEVDWGDGTAELVPMDGSGAA